FAQRAIEVAVVETKVEIEVVVEIAIERRRRLYRLQRVRNLAEGEAGAYIHARAVQVGREHHALAGEVQRIGRAHSKAVALAVIVYGRSEDVAHDADLAQRRFGYAGLLRAYQCGRGAKAHYGEAKGGELRKLDGIHRSVSPGKGCVSQQRVQVLVV